jgi:signal transduction histidine kinase/FixJ family two-component response regulator
LPSESPVSTLPSDIATYIKKCWKTRETLELQHTDLCSQDLLESSSEPTSSSNDPSNPQEQAKPKQLILNNQRIVLKPIITELGDPQGILVLVTSPYLMYDDSYKTFLDLACHEFSLALSHAASLHLAQSRAEGLAALDKAKTTFFTSISHELRTPLTLILGPLHDCLHDSQFRMPKTMRTYLQLAHSNGIRLLKLVNSFLDYNRIQTGRMLADFRPTDLSKKTLELCGIFRSAIENGGLEFHAEMGKGVNGVPCYVDVSMYEKIVMNLLGNAYKFTLQGQITCSLDVSEDEKFLVLKVADTGVGIPEKEISRIFERFHRVEGTKGRSFEGSGIGLALTEEMVRLHKGTITVSSVEGQGSTFTVLMPLGTSHIPRETLQKVEARLKKESEKGGDWMLDSCMIQSSIGHAFVDEAKRWRSGDAPPEEDDVPSEDENGCSSQSSTLSRSKTGNISGMSSNGTGMSLAFSEESMASNHTTMASNGNGNMHRIQSLHSRSGIIRHKPRVDTSHMTVFIVDDNADMRLYLSELVRTRWKVRSYENGATAFEAAKEDPPHLILTDIMMPIMNGIELLQAMRNNETTMDIPVILLSGQAGEEARVSGLEAGADDYMVKPFNGKELLARIRIHLELKQMRSNLEQTIAEQTAEIARNAIKYRQIIQLCPAALVRTDKDGFVTFVNEQFVNMLGAPEEEFYSRTNSVRNPIVRERYE